MWPRAVETMLGVWLVLSPWIIGHYPEDRGMWLSDLICGGLVIVIALAACWGRLRRLHLLEIAIALWLIGFGYFDGGYPNEPQHKNAILTGLVLGLFAIIPTDANAPPTGWRRYYEERAGEAG